MKKITLKTISSSKAFKLSALAAFVLGAVLGRVIPGFFDAIAFIGTSYVKLLKLIVVPLLMTEISLCLYTAAGKYKGRVLRTVGLFVAMFTATFLLTALIVGIARPGIGLELLGEDWTGTLAATTVQDFFANIISDNILASMAAGSMLPCILFAFVFGIAAHHMKAEKAMGVVEDIKGVFERILDNVLVLTPLGVFSLMGSASAQYGASVLGTGARYIATAWGLSAAALVIVMILPVWIFAGINPVSYIRRAAKVWLMTLSTCSSAATLPTTVRVCNEEFGVPEEVTDIVVPLGCTIHMCGGAVSFCLLGLFTLQMAGIPLTIGTFLYMLIVAVLMNMAAPGIPGGGIVLGATYLTILGAPTGFIGLYSGIYRVLDMAYTTLNVTGDITANVLIQKWEKK